MRRYGLILTALLLASIPALAQPPRTPPAAPPTPIVDQKPLDGYLLRWEQEMGKVQTLAAQINRIDREKTFEKIDKYSGYAQFLRAGTGPTAANLAILQFNRAGTTEVVEKFILTDTFVYVFAPAQKEIRYYELPKPRPGRVADDNAISFLFGLKAAEAKKRYDLKLFREDKWYIYVDVTPRFPEDRRDFQRARIVLNKTTFLPRQLWFEHPNGNEVTWDLPTVQSGVKLNRKDFDRPEPPAGWKLVPGTRPTTVPPRVIRPNR